MKRHPFECPWLLQGFFHGGLERQNGVDARDLEEFQNAIGGADYGDFVACPLTVDVVIDEHAQAGGVHVGDLREVDDGERWFLFAKLSLELEEIAQDEGAAEFENSHAGLGGSGDFDLQWRTVHAA